MKGRLLGAILLTLLLCACGSPLRQSMEYTAAGPAAEPALPEEATLEALLLHQQGGRGEIGLQLPEGTDVRLELTYVYAGEALRSTFLGKVQQERVAFAFELPQDLPDQLALLRLKPEGEAEQMIALPLPGEQSCLQHEMEKIDQSLGGLLAGIELREGENLLELRLSPGLKELEESKQQEILADYAQRYADLLLLLGYFPEEELTVLCLDEQNRQLLQYQGQEQALESVYANLSSGKYHRADCSSRSQRCEEMTRSQAEDLGCEPCGRCFA